MRQSNLEGLWVRYGRLGPDVLARVGLDWRTHMRYLEHRDNRRLVLVIKRAKPNEGFDIGNFSIDSNTLNWLINQQSGSRRSTGQVDECYIALVENYGKPPIISDTALNIRAKLNGTEPYKDGTRNYYWVDEEFQPVGSSFGPVLHDSDDLPF